MHVSIAFVHDTGSSTTTSSRFSRNSETNASEFSECIEEMFPRWYMHIDESSRLKSTITNMGRGVVELDIYVKIVYAYQL